MPIESVGEHDEENQIEEKPPEEKKKILEGKLSSKEKKEADGKPVRKQELPKNCPSCGAFTGGSSTCPNCEADINPTWP
jgi:hypothetical protein